MNRQLGWVAIFGLGLAGCGGSTGVPVTGLVTLDGKALPGALVSFRPTGQKTEGLGGSGMTGADGKYVIQEARGGKGIASGDYTVVISRRLRPDGSAPPLDVPPMESDARETLPAKYSDPKQSTLRATVSKDKAVHDFPLVTKKK
jgi:hypothetical protein